MFITSVDSNKSFAGSRLFVVTLWFLVLIIFALIVTLVDYEFNDPDSRLYSKLAQQLSEKPIGSWIAPRWVAYSGTETYFREHPSGVIWVSAALIRSGAPKEQASAIANFLYILITFLFIFKIGRTIKENATGWAMVLASFLMPASFLYIVRGNLEPPLTMAVVIGVYSLVKCKESWIYGVCYAVALVLAVFFKGLQGGFVGIIGVLYWLTISQDKRHFYVLVGSAVVLLSTMGVYEILYQSQTGEEFWLANFGIQAVTAVETNSLWQKPYNLIWYLVRVLYFALPWTVFLLLGVRNSDERSYIPKDKRFLWLLACVGLLILIMSLFDRRADRYIYPSYILMGMAGGWYVSGRFQRVKKWLSASPVLTHISFAVLVLSVAIIKVLVSTHLYSDIQFWRE
jgi:4-amino-4-deoxy-L-arabinose transferase-like glycosyltransferase